MKIFRIAENNACHTIIYINVSDYLLLLLLAPLILQRRKLKFREIKKFAPRLDNSMGDKSENLKLCS